MLFGNISCVQPSPLILKLRVWQYSLYGLSGGTAFLLNIFISLAILKYRALREEKTYQVIGCLSLADSIFGLGHLLGGCYRLILLKLGVAYCPMARIYCMFMPQTFLWRIGGVTAALMLVVVSWHRFVAVTRPLVFLTHSYKQAVTKMLIAVYGIGLIFCLIHCVYPVKTAETLVPAYCGTRYVLKAELYNVEVFFSRVADIVSCGIYGVLIVVFHKQNAAAQATDQSEMERRITVTLGFSSLLTFVLVCLPPFVMRLSKGNFAIVAQFSSYVSILMQWNAVANFFLYGMRQAEMARALKGLLTGKHLPENLRDWHATVPHTHN